MCYLCYTVHSLDGVELDDEEVVDDGEDDVSAPMMELHQILLLVLLQGLRQVEKVNLIYLGPVLSYGGTLNQLMKTVVELRLSQEQPLSLHLALSTLNVRVEVEVAVEVLVIRNHFVRMYDDSMDIHLAIQDQP